MTSLVLQASALTGTPPDQLRLVGLLLFSIPLSLLFPYLPADPSYLPHLYAALPGVYFLCGVLDLRRGFVELLASAVVAWLVIRHGVRNKKGREMPWMVFGAAMGHLVANDVLRHLSKTAPQDVDISACQMVLVIKLTSFAWSVHDGQLPDAELDPTQRASKIVEVPGLVPFLGYCFFFPSLLAGPAFTFATYQSFVTRSLFVKEMTRKDNKEVLGEKMVIPPGRRRKAAKRCLTGLFYIGVYALFSSKFSYFKLLERDVATRSFFYKFAFMNCAGLVARTKYYAAWCIAESACIVSGIGYNPATGSYDAARNIRIRSFELAPNFKTMLDSWNLHTNVWLRECIYKRVTKPGTKPGFASAQITFITSALWHGINPCYLLTFIMGGFYQALATTSSILHRPSFIPPPQPPRKWAYDILGVLCTQSGINFIVVPFCALEIRSSLAIWRSVGYYGIWACLVPLIAFRLGGAKHLSKLLKIRDARYADQCQVTWKTGEEVQINWLNSPPGVVNVQLASSDGKTTYPIANGVPGTTSYEKCDGGTGFGQKGGKPCGAVRIAVPAAWVPGTYSVNVASVSDPKTIGYTDTITLSKK
ncbi:hypothetical protein RQP46_003280 [Phenoliferia psychrophenolica]